MTQIRISRRTFAQTGIATAGLVIASGARAITQLAPTSGSPMGPFYPVVRPADSDADLTRIKGHSERASGQVIEIAGRVFDVRGNPLPGVELELWQANSAGRYDHPSDISKAPLDPHFQGFASLRTDAAGNWRIVTIKPGGYDSPIGRRPPHIHWDIRSQKTRNVAQMYFPEDADGNAKDQLYAALGAAAATSLAVREASDPNRYRWDIVMLG